MDRATWSHQSYWRPRSQEKPGGKEEKEEQPTHWLHCCVCGTKMHTHTVLHVSRHDLIIS